MINELLTLSQTDSGFVANNHYTNINGSLFGGQVIAQSLMAVSGVIDVQARALHSMHVYFVNRGDDHSPVNYRVSKVREGRSFTAISVVASQHDRDIFIASMSFQQKEDNGLNHVAVFSDVAEPTQDDIDRVLGYAEKAKTDPRFRLFAAERNRLFDIVSTRENPMMLYQDGSTRSEFWIKASEHIEDNNLAKHQSCLLAASDMGILFSSLAPYKINLEKTQITSIDHSVWLHNPNIDMNSWHLIKTHSCWAANSRSLVKAEIFNSAGELVASVAQEGLIRTEVLS